MTERPVYRVVQIAPSLWLQATAGMSPLERGALLDAFTKACVAGDDAFLDTLLFAGRRLRARPPRKGISPDVRRRVLARNGGRCVLCGVATAREIDHILAVVRGGDDNESNLQGACRPCNREKGPRPYERRRMVANG